MQRKYLFSRYSYETGVMYDFYADSENYAGLVPTTYELDRLTPGAMYFELTYEPWARVLKTDNSDLTIIVRHPNLSQEEAINWL